MSECRDLLYSLKPLLAVVRNGVEEVNQKGLKEEQAILKQKQEEEEKRKQQLEEQKRAQEKQAAAVKVQV